MDALSPEPRTGLQRRDCWLLLGFCLALYGFSALYERPLNSHESIHCQNVREMLASGDWVIPTCGGRPWLERPPLPHWLTALFAVPFGAEAVWSYRLGSFAAGMAVVLLGAWIGAVFLGRGLGILTGLVLATMLEFHTYAVGPECDIFLCLIVTGALACFVKLEFVLRPRPTAESVGFLGRRPWPVLAFFLLLGLTNLAKGLIFGMLFVLVPVVIYLLATGSWSLMRRYVWGWGWLAFLTTALPWPLAAYMRQPGVLDLWHSDYIGRLNQGFMREPPWYYAVELPRILFPWAPFALGGLVLTARKALRATSPERFLWCWSVATVAFFSIPQGKHHHYLLHVLVPWAVLASLGAHAFWKWLQDRPAWMRSAWPGLTLGLIAAAVVWVVRDKLPGGEPAAIGAAVVLPLLLGLLGWGCTRPRAGLAAAGVFGALLLGYWAAWAYRTTCLNKYGDDIAFLEEVRRTVPGEATIFVKADPHPLNTPWLLFYLRDRTRLLHNLTFLRDDRIEAATLYLVARGEDVEEIRQYGHPEVMLKSRWTRTQRSAHDQYTLFRLRLNPDLRRLPATLVQVSPMQATGRAIGPFLQ